MSTASNGCPKPTDVRPPPVRQPTAKPKPAVAAKPVVPAKPTHIPPPLSVRAPTAVGAGSQTHQQPQHQQQQQCQPPFAQRLPHHLQTQQSGQQVASVQPSHPHTPVIPQHPGASGVGIATLSTTTDGGAVNKASQPADAATTTTTTTTTNNHQNNHNTAAWHNRGANNKAEPAPGCADPTTATHLPTQSTTDAGNSAPPHSHQRLPSSGGASAPLVICRGRTASTASAGGGSTAGSDIDRTSAQLEAIKQKSLDLDNRLPAHFHGSDSLDGDGSRRVGSGTSATSGGAHAPSRAPSKFFQQSSKQLEEILAQRLEKEAMHRGRKGSASMGGASAGTTGATKRGDTGGAGSGSCSAGGGAGGGGVPKTGGPDANSGAAAVLKTLNDEMKRHCRIIQEKHLIERRWPQQAYGAASGVGGHEAPIDEEMHHITVRGAGSLPSHSLGLTKIRPSIFGDQPGKDGAVGHRRHGSCASATGDANHQLDNPDDNSLIYRDSALISGSLDSLIQHMVPTADYYPDKSYLFAFLLSARLFVRPHQLLDRVCRLCDAQQQLGLEMAPLPDTPTLSNSSTTTNTSASQHIISHLGTSQTMPLQAPPFASTATTTSAPSSVSALPVTSDSNRRFAANFVRLLADWIETFPYDFRDERLMLHVRRMTQKCIQLDPSRRRDISAMLQSLLHRLTLLDQYEEYLGRVQCGADAAANGTSSGSSGAIPSGGGGGVLGGLLPDDLQLHCHHHSSPYPQVVDFTEVCVSASQLAHQLTHIELERLSHIGPEEFVQAFAKEQQFPPTATDGSQQPASSSGATGRRSSSGDIKKTRNLESYVAWFNRLSYLVASEIVKHPKKKQRVRVIEYWIETARECFNIGNFNSLMAIIAGLNMSPISRLKKTWAKAQSAKFMVLEHQMDPTSNFHSYRSTLKAAMWRSAGATDERQRIVIPFFSLLVKDLYFLNEGCSNRLPNGHINFDKFWQLAKQVQEFIGWKQVQCTFERQSRITWMLQTAAVLAENSLALASFECEQADSATEKDRYKSLKAEVAAAAHAHASSGSSMPSSSSGSTVGGHQNPAASGDR